MSNRKARKSLANQKRIQISAQTSGISEQAFGSRYADGLLSDTSGCRPRNCDYMVNFQPVKPGSPLAGLRFFHVIAKLIFGVLNSCAEIPANRASPPHVDRLLSRTFRHVGVVFLF